MHVPKTYERLLSHLVLKIQESKEFSTLMTSRAEHEIHLAPALWLMHIAWSSLLPGSNSGCAIKKLNSTEDSNLKIY